MATAYHAVNDSDPLINFEIEAELLGGLMLDNASVDAVADLVTANDFSEAILGRIFDAIVHECSRGNRANALTLKGYFDRDKDVARLGGVSFLANLTGNYAGMPLIETAKSVADLARRRTMRSGLMAVAEECSDLNVPATAIVTHADAAVSENAREAIHQPTGGECFDELIKSFDEDRHGVLCRQIPALDDLLGPLRPKQLIIAAARPGMGKTAVALSYSIGAAKAGHGVLFVSLEMSSTELASRMAADMCFDGTQGVPYSFIRDRELNNWQRRKVVEAGSAMHGLPLNVVDAGHLNTGRLAMLARRHARKLEARGHKLELIVVDYLQLLSPDSRGRSNYEAVSEVSKALKALAKEMGCAVLALAQLSREVEKRPDKRPQLSDLRDSGQIEQDADAVLFLLRQEYYLRQAEPDPMEASRITWEQAMRDYAGKIEFILAKRRDGTAGNTVGEFHGAYQAVR